MKKQREFKQIVISKKGCRWLENGHPWLYESDVIKSDDDIENGAIVDVVSEQGKYLGSGFLSLKSKIRVRLLSRNANDVYDEAFWQRRVEYAYAYRKTVLPDAKSYRLIFGESDGFPGLTVDRFENVLVAQVLTYGLDIRKDLIFRLIIDTLKKDGQDIIGIYERNDVAIREKEGLVQYKAWYNGEHDIKEVIIKENDISYYVDFINGQKTGFFLDQQNNRASVAKLSRNKKVLDCFTHTGSFALNCAKAKASVVTAVDISAVALEQAKRNAKLNDLKVEFVKEDTFAFLENCPKKYYDLIILDPPAFTKSKDTFRNAYNGYKQLNYLAMKLLNRGSYLATCSCSHFMPHADFERMLKEAAKMAGVEIKQISVSQQNVDHPILWNCEETDYLKFFILQII